jgi:hypothetical protein
MKDFSKIQVKSAMIDFVPFNVCVVRSFPMILIVLNICAVLFSAS